MFFGSQGNMDQIGWQVRKQSENIERMSLRVRKASNPIYDHVRHMRETNARHDRQPIGAPTLHTVQTIL